MLLTGLNIDCLEGIFEYLELRDLLNVADSNKRLRHASKFVFVRKYGSREFGLEHSCVNRNGYIKIYYGIFLVPDLKLILSLLRIFGSLISRIIYCDYGYSLKMTPRSNYVADYINDFCSETLCHIRMYMCYRDSLDYFKNPFTRVETVFVQTRSFTQKNNLVRLFPKMQKLTAQVINNDEFIWSECMANHFPFLEYLDMQAIFKDVHKKDEKCIKAFKHFLRLNPQLKYFSLHCEDQAEINILQVFEERDQNPEHLELSVADNFFNCFNGKKLYLKNVKHLSISSLFRQPLLEGIPFLCNQLETFEIHLLRQFNEHIYDFCQNNSSIRKLKYAIYSNIPINFSRLAQSLPLLEEITNFGGKISVDEALHVLSLFKCLKYLRFRCSDHFECKQLQSRLSDNWSMHFTTEGSINYVTFKR